MKKNILIIALVALNIGTAYLYFKNRPVQFLNSYVYFPAVALAKNERIIAADLQFQSAVVKSVRNIPPGWNFSINLDTPPRPVAMGSILVGAAAVGSVSELPFFELGGYGTGARPGALRARYTIAQYPGGPGKARTVTVEVKK